MESLVEEASQELARKLSVDNVTRSTVAKFKEENNACIKRVEETAQLTAKVQSETELINDMVRSLREKNQELQATFDKIDQLEIIINKVKATYNAVAENLDTVEKAVSASTRRGRSDIPIQPYFPPPKPVEIFDAKELLSTVDLN